jgi:hypothetical protein
MIVSKKPIKVNWKVRRAAEKIRLFWVSVQDPDPWKNMGARQAYRDALQMLKESGLINDYSLDKIE